MRPIYFSRDHKRNPSKLAAEKEKMVNKIQTAMLWYGMIKKKDQKHLLKLRKKVNQCFKQPELLAYNKPF